MSKLEKAIELKLAGNEKAADDMLREHIHEIAVETTDDAMSEIFASLGIKYVRMD